MTPAQSFELVLTGGPTPHRFTVFVPDEGGGRAAEHAFEWRTDSTALAMDLGALARAAIEGHPPEHDLHRIFGQHLFETVFVGEVGDLWQARRAELKPTRKPLRLVVRVDPQTARPLLNLPLEYLHDGHDFLALNWRTPLSRLPWGLPPESLPPLTEPLRVLVLVAAPLGLSQNQVLNTAREEDLILGALGAARRAGRIEVTFAPNGVPETLETLLREFDPHVLHFVGHGVFVSARDTGFLLMETTDGRKRDVPNAELVRLIERQARSLRLVFLSACQTAVAPRNEGFADLAPRLLGAGVPAVVAMQYSVLNQSAMDFGSAFYKGIADGEPIDVALTEARVRLAQEGLNTVDFATPVLFLADPGCLRVDQAALRPTPPRAELDLTGVTRAQQFVGRSAELRELQMGLDPERGRWRAAVVYGLGGMGKTVLAARLAERMAPQLDGAKALRMTPTTTAQEVLDQVEAFLLVGNARWNSPLIGEFMRMSGEALPLEAKAAKLIQVLRALRLLVIFDNYEDVLPGGRAVSRAAQEWQSEGAAPEAQVGLDPDLPRLVALLIDGVEAPSCFVFTSRVDLSPVEAGRLGSAVGHVALGEMQFRDAVYLMETLPPLDRLPVAVLPEVRPDVPPVPPALSMRDVYERLGGHPYTLGLFAEHARCSSVEAVLADLGEVRKELLEFTLLERAAKAAPERAGELLRRAAIYDEPVAVEGLAFLMGNGQDAMAEVAEEVEVLVEWGLLARPLGEEAYAVPTPVREWARGAIGADERLSLLRRAAEFWLTTGNDSRDLADFLRARHYLFLAGDYEQADDIVEAATELLHHWGQIELLVRLLSESVRTVSKEKRAVALSNLGIVYQGLGEYGRAREYAEQSLANFQDLSDRHNVAAVLYQLGNLHYLQGKYGQARERYEQALAIAEELGNRAGVAHSLHQLGMLHQAQGEYAQARQRYQQALVIKQELGDRAGVACSLHALGMLHQAQGEYGRAREHYEQALAIAGELGNRAGVARSLHQLGTLHQGQREYAQARERYEQALAIFEELGDRDSAARSLGGLGMLDYLQGEYGRARERYEQALTTFQELGDWDGVARSLAHRGLLFEREGDLAQATATLAHALAILEQLGSSERDLARRDLARLREKMGREPFEAALQEAAASAAARAGGTSAGPQMPSEQVVQLVVGKTVAVLTDAPEKRGEWWETLGQLQEQARAQELGDFSTFLGLLQQLVEGTQPGHLEAHVPPPFRQAWNDVVHGIAEQEEQNG